MNQEDLQNLEEEYLRNFNERMASMSHYHQETIGLLLAKRMTEDIEILTRPPKRYQRWPIQFGAWILQRVAAYIQQDALESPIEPVGGRVIVVDTSTEIFVPDSPKYDVGSQTRVDFWQPDGADTPSLDNPCISEDEVG